MSHFLSVADASVSLTERLRKTRFYFSAMQAPAKKNVGAMLPQLGGVLVCHACGQRSDNAPLGILRLSVELTFVLHVSTNFFYKSPNYRLESNVVAFISLFDFSFYPQTSVVASILK